MCHEFYSVCVDEQGKYIDYHGFVWNRDNADEERDERTGELLDFAYTYGKCENVYFDEIAGNPLEAVSLKFESCQQYQEDMSEGQKYLTIRNFYGTGECGTRLHISDVGADTPCGDYFYDSENDEPHFKFVDGKTYAAYTDAWDDMADEFLKGFLKSELPETEIDFESDTYMEYVFELTREFLIPTLERFGLRERWDGK